MKNDKIRFCGGLNLKINIHKQENAKSKNLNVQSWVCRNCMISCVDQFRMNTVCRMCASTSACLHRHPAAHLGSRNARSGTPMVSNRIVKSNGPRDNKRRASSRPESCTKPTHFSSLLRPSQISPFLIIIIKVILSFLVLRLLWDISRLKLFHLNPWSGSSDKPRNI